MASIVPDNPVDVQPQAPKPGIVGGVINSVANPTSANAQLSQHNPTANLQQQSYTAQTREVDPAKETVQGQLTSILASDNPLMQRARTLAAQQMAQRGLVNSSMAQGAGVAAMIDRATPIAAQDAQAHDTRARANMDATNTAGMFNVGQNNQLLGQGMTIAAQMQQQKDQQQFAAGEADKDRAHQGQSQDKQNAFAAAQAELERAQQHALQDKSAAAQQALQEAQQKFQEAQAALDRSQQTNILGTQQAFQAAQAELERAQQHALQDKSVAAQQALQEAQQKFQEAQAALDRGHSTTTMQAQQAFTAAQAELERAQQTALADKSIAAQTALQEAQQKFQEAQAGLDRAQQMTVIGAQQAFTAAQADLDRALQVAQTDKSIAAQVSLQEAQQKFSAAQAELDRAQQMTMADKQLDAQKQLQVAQQEFAAIQAQLDRDQQTELTKLQQQFNESAASKDFAATTASNTLNAINSILADPNLKPDAKRAAVNNAIAAANSTMKWASTFYQTQMPQLAAPASTESEQSKLRLVAGRLVG